MSVKEAIDLTYKIAVKEEKAAGLLKLLAVAMAIKEIWPEAFDDGQGCTFGAREVVTTMQKYRELRKRGKTPELKECYLRRSDGVKFTIDTETYWRLKEMPR